MYNGMRSTNKWAALYFTTLMAVGYYVLFNLLVAILVEGFTNSGVSVNSLGIFQDSFMCNVLINLLMKICQVKVHKKELLKSNNIGLNLHQLGKRVVFVTEMFRRENLLSFLKESRNENGE